MSIQLRLKTRTRSVCVFILFSSALRNLDRRTNAGIDSTLKFCGTLHVKRSRESNFKMND